MASARGVGERGRARDEYDAISRALPLLDAARSPGTTLRVSAYISWMGTSCYAAMLQRAGVLTEAAEGAAWSGATTGITRSGRRGGSCRVTQDTASRTAAPSPCQSNKHFDLLLRVFLSPHMAPTQAAVEEKDDEEERTPQVCPRRSWASPSPRREGDSRQALVAATVGGHKSGAGVLEYLIGRGRSRPGTSRQGGDLHNGQHDASGRPGARGSGGLGLGCLVADKGM